MPLVATLDGKTIVSILCNDSEWLEAVQASKGPQTRLKMTCCGALARANHSPLGLRFFAHKSKSNSCPSGGESVEHDTLKWAAALAITSRLGWEAECEVSQDRWRTDVFAVRGSVKIAIEVQLSNQAKRETAKRNDKFENSKVTPFWLKGPKNHFNDFGAGLQSAILGTDLRDQFSSAQNEVRKFLAAVERQIFLTKGIIKIIKMTGWRYEIVRQGSVPACLELSHGEKKQTIVLAELGAGLLPNLFEPRRGNILEEDQFSGAIIQVRSKAPEFREFRASSLVIQEDSIDADLERLLRPILEGKRKWQGNDHKELVPASFVHFAEQCQHCHDAFLRISHVIVGHVRHPINFPPEIVRYTASNSSDIREDGRKLAASLGMKLAINISGEYFSCPHCSRLLDDKLFLSDEEVLECWPMREEHFNCLCSLPGVGWSEPLHWAERSMPSAECWKALLDNKMLERARGRDQRRCASEARDADRRLRQEEQTKKEAVRAAELRKASEDDQRKRKIEDQQSRLEVLRREAEKILPGPSHCEAWMTNPNPLLRGLGDTYAPRPIELAKASREGLDRALLLLRGLKKK